MPCLVLMRDVVTSTAKEKKPNDIINKTLGENNAVKHRLRQKFHRRFT